MAGMSKFAGNFEIKPSLLVKSDFISTSVDVNVIAEWNSLVWGGLGFRSQDALNPMAGVNISLPGSSSLTQSAKLGISYDVGLSELAKNSDGGIEIFLGYCWKFVPPVIRKSHGNPRWL